MMRSMIRFVFVVSLLWGFGVSQLHAQAFSWGVQGGFSLLGALDVNFANDESRRYAIGPTVELALPGPFALEASGLYRRVGYSSVGIGIVSKTISRVRGNSWEFPFLLKCYVSESGAVQPYVTGGYVLRHVSGLDSVAHFVGVDFQTGEPFEMTLESDTTFLLADNPTHGFALGGGIRMRAGFLSVAPEIRYTRWTGRPFDEEGSRGLLVISKQDQLEVLVSLTF